MGWGNGSSRRAGPSAGRGASPRTRAFTLPELALVLALITLLAVVAIPLFYGRPGVTLDSAAILLAKDLRYAQNLAVERGIEMSLEFAPDASGYRVTDAHGRPVPNPLGSGELARDYRRDAVFEGVTIESVQLGPTPRARFSPTGLALQGGTIRLAYRSHQRTLHLQAGTGLIDLEGLTRPWTDTGR